MTQEGDKDDKSEREKEKEREFKDKRSSKSVIIALLRFSTRFDLLEKFSAKWKFKSERKLNKKSI